MTTTEKLLGDLATALLGLRRECQAKGSADPVLTACFQLGCEHSSESLVLLIASEANYRDVLLPAMTASERLARFRAYPDGDVIPDGLPCEP